ncbi:MAG: pyridoxine 5'-phosphate synthase [Gemmatimonadota bacterium]|nr:pyridoxine 5'-phosphate synthase [Gemmatimonadota bacterium]MDQ8167979.1 pyridoxine 5'-phosphate synthase [Gemmatimonadota bacterium]MDQ8173915.1 pyridoxine 5'-phosphate synthase [Gemmatimonadota bacterium]
MSLRYQRLYVNIDHVATVRQARRSPEPDPVAAARLCEQAGADGITAHLREDRRHIQDEDIRRLAAAVTTALNFECAATNEMLALAEALRPTAVTLVPERREEVTTEGGLDLERAAPQLRDAIARLQRAGVRTSLFIDADADAVRQAQALGADAIELHTGPYAHAPADPRTLRALADAAALGASLGMAVHAGHGLSVQNVGPVAAIAEIEELNIGHAIVGRAIFVGMVEAVREIRRAMDDAREADRF